MSLRHPLSGLVDLLASRDPRRRLRLVQWLIAGLVYAGAATLLVVGVGQGWMARSALELWLTFVGAVLAAGYVALRSGWTERFRDPSITVWQLSMGVVAVNWGYLICGPMRTSALFPIMVIFAFGAFALRWKQIAFLTVLAVAGLATAVLIRTLHPHWFPTPGEVDPSQVDLNNILMLIVVLPALSVIAVRLSSLRQKLRDQREALARALSDLERLATIDELTGVPNRRSMKALLERSIALAEREHGAFCVVILDIDHFKAVNDAFGHAVGDSVLRAFGTHARAQLRATDVLGRWGGEEFLLVLPGEPSGVPPVLERIRAAVRNGCLDGHAVTWSAGIAECRSGEGADALLARADVALYEAKRAGRDRWVMGEASGSSGYQRHPA